jgi:hypothetical protein
VVPFDVDRPSESPRKSPAQRYETTGHSDERNAF